ncbi:MAG: PilZ domain-containing protein [Nitrospira sp.]|nr:PilZ domain-containing protein [Nitrospira sp.]
MLNLPVTVSTKHNGKALQLDSQAETMALIGPADEPLGTVSWEAVIDFIHSSSKTSHPQRPPRNHTRSPLAATLRYSTPGNKNSAGVTCEIGGGGIFIETAAPPKIGTILTLELALPDDPANPIIAQGQVAWVRPAEERHVLYPGMGVQFIKISDESRARIVNMVKLLDRSRSGK